MKPLTAQTALDTYFLEARSKILDLAGILDRIGRGEGDAAGDTRLEKVRQALAARLKELGFRFVTIDLEGLRSGSMNELVPLELKQRYASRP